MSKYTPYIFLDESGNLDFSCKGTEYFVLTSVSATRPFQITGPLASYKYNCIERGLPQERFHCADDNFHVRNKVFTIIGDGLESIDIDSLVVEKRKANPALRPDNRFYPEMLGHLLKYVLDKSMYSEAEEIIIVTDQLPIKRRRQAVEKAIKATLAHMVNVSPRYRILHHDSRSHYGLQIADYCCWAIFRKHERKDDSYFNRIRPAVHSEFEIFSSETNLYY